MAEHATTGRGRNWVRRAATVAVAAAFVAAGASPAGAQTAPFSTAPASNAYTAGGTPNLVLVSDSLVAGNIGSQTMANTLEAGTGRGAYVSAALGATWVTYVAPGEQNGNSLVWDLANFFDARLTVGALATNDARLLTQYPSDYSQQDQYNFMSLGVNATRQHSSCVLLVNVRARTVPKGDGSGVGMSAASATTVNNNMTWLAAVSSRVYVADWNAHASGHDSTWFKPNDVHLTIAGATAYKAFIEDRVEALIADHSC